MARLSWDEYFLGIMDAVAKRATCDRGKSGCVIVKDKHILATGYVGAPAGVMHCDDSGHEFIESINENGNKSRHCVRTTHAEQNAIVDAARFGISLQDSTLYCKMTPCYACAKIIINAGVMRVVALKDYQSGKRSKEVFLQAGMQFEIISPEVEQYGEVKNGS